MNEQQKDKRHKDDIYYDTSDSYILEKKDLWKIRIIKRFSHKKGLDIGCGSGRWLERFPGWNGIDIDERAKTNGRVKIGSVVKIPFNKNSFEVVLASHVLEHVERKDFIKAISEIRRVLKKNGTLVIFGPNPAHQNFHHDYTHINPINIVSLCSVLKNNGFDVIESDFSVYKRFWLGKFIPKGIMNTFAPLFMTEYYVVAKKN